MPENGRIFIDDLEGVPSAPRAPLPGPALPQIGEREDFMRRRNLAPSPAPFADEDPYSPAYARMDVEETAGTILHYWFGYAAERPSSLQDRMTLWFGGGFELDRIIAHRFSRILARLASGEAFRWAASSPRERLAAIIALDQFSRNIFRGSAAAFENDHIALLLAREGVTCGDDLKLTPVERWFFYMPFEHSETAADQAISVEKFTELLQACAPEHKDPFAAALDFARRHAEVIETFGRFPHRNEALGRASSAAEQAFLETRPAGF